MTKMGKKAQLKTPVDVPKAQDTIAPTPQVLLLEFDK
jgi:hypothetical protein